MDWGALGFDYRKTDANVRYYYTDGKWSEMEITGDEYIKIHMSASCLHYGIELFEGLKAFRGVDGKVRLFPCRGERQAVAVFCRTSLPSCSDDRNDRKGLRRSGKTQ